MKHLQQAKQQATRLTARLDQLGVKLKRTQALEAVAAAHNFSDWNRFQAFCEREAASAEPTGEAQSNLVLMTRPGEGKSSTLLAEFLDAMQKQRGVPLVITCSDQFFQFRAPDAGIGDKNIDVIDVDWKTADGMRSPKADADGIIVTINAPAGDLAATQAAVQRAIAAIQAQWSPDVTEKVGCILLDEWQRLGRDQVSACVQIASLPFRSATPIVVATHPTAAEAPRWPDSFKIVTTRACITSHCAAEILSAGSELTIIDEQAPPKQVVARKESRIEGFARICMRSAHAGAGNRTSVTVSHLDMLKVISSCLAAAAEC